MNQRLLLAAIAIVGTVAIVVSAMKFGLSEGAIQSLVAGLVAPLTALVVAGGRIEAAKLLPSPNAEQLTQMTAAATDAATKAAVVSVSQMPTAMPVAPYPTSPLPGEPRTQSQQMAAVNVPIPRAPSIPDIPEDKE